MLPSSELPQTHLGSRSCSSIQRRSVTRLQPVLFRDAFSSCCAGLKSPMCIFLCSWLTTKFFRLHILKLFPSVSWAFVVVYEKQKS